MKKRRADPRIKQTEAERRKQREQARTELVKRHKYEYLQILETIKEESA